MIRRLGPVLAVLMTAVGCASMSVSSHMEPNLQTTAYHTFGWGTPDPLPTGDPRLDQDPFFKDRIEGAVEKQMSARGFTFTDKDPDLRLHYHAVITPRLDVNRVDREYGYCYDDTCSARVFDYEQGTLVIDVVDVKTNRVIWRGWAQETIEPALKNQDRMAKDIAEAVQRMLARFPRSL
jgi:hypothetical protein